MSRENVDFVRSGWQAYEEGDLSRALAAFGPDVVTHVAPPAPVAGTYHGPEGFLQVTIDWAEGFDELVITGEEFIDAGGQVVVRSLHKSRGAESGVPVEATVWYVFTVQAQKVVHVAIFTEEREALEAAGLSEQDAHADS